MTIAGNGGHPKSDCLAGIKGEVGFLRFHTVWDLKGNVLYRAQISSSHILAMFLNNYSKVNLNLS